MKLEENLLSGNVWHRTIKGTRYTWDIPTLIQHAKEKKYKTFDLPIDGIDVGWNPFDCDSLFDFINHVKRVNESDLKFPILIDDLGTICDGWHRVVKAVLRKDKYIKAIKLEEMPSASKMEKV